MRILVVEDDPIIADGVKVSLEHEGYAIDVLADGGQALEALKNEVFDIVLLDIGLPGLDGFEVLKRLRGNNCKNSSVPVLMLTARDAIEYRVQGLDFGADDYLVKPFDIHELVARIRALTRRSKGRANSILQYKEVVLDPAAHSVTYQNTPANLLPKEFSVLFALMENQGKVVSKERLEETIYAWNEEPGSNALEVHVHHLRKKLSGELIRTIRGIGYIMP